MPNAPSHRASAAAQSAALHHVLRVGAKAGQPDTLFEAVEAALAEVVGHKLFTVLQVHSADEVERLYTNMPQDYPVKGRKRMGPTPWGKHVLDGQEPYLGRNAEDIRWAFPDHELIESLGCRSTLNIPVLWNGRTLGTVNMLHEEDYYQDADIEVATPLVQALVPALS